MSANTNEVLKMLMEIPEFRNAYNDRLSKAREAFLSQKRPQAEMHDHLKQAAATFIRQFVTAVAETEGKDSPVRQDQKQNKKQSKMNSPKNCSGKA